jgi:hypothetical protein
MIFFDENPRSSDPQAAAQRAPYLSCAAPYADAQHMSSIIIENEEESVPAFGRHI